MLAILFFLGCCEVCLAFMRPPSLAVPTGSRREGSVGRLPMPFAAPAEATVIPVSPLRPPPSSILPPPATGSSAPLTTSSVVFETGVADVKDYGAVADLRLSVFTPYPEPVRQRFRARAREKMLERRMKGASVLTSTASFRLPGEVADRRQIVGTLECSTHEFERAPCLRSSCGNNLDDFDGASRLYITEVAVDSAMRRRGIAMSLIRGAEDFARGRGVQELYLHVDAQNEGALRFYERAGFRVVDDSIDTYTFAMALGLHSGSFANVQHILMAKDVKPNPPSAPASSLTQALRSISALRR